ncbi:zinc finger protein 726-like [Ischnura elegans]|uniref:zinc finger protein 726-like n=1 Tax=Ischnura elegans TaxID=197161 RepID=UPI001ED8ACF3|nr:zinc finger protein 726-like [Ischnura elegans]
MEVVNIRTGGGTTGYVRGAKCAWNGGAIRVHAGEAEGLSRADPHGGEGVPVRLVTQGVQDEERPPTPHPIPHRSQTCNKRYKTKACLTNHVRNDHRSGAEERPFKCRLCSKAFRLNAILKAHEITHTDLKPFACEVCGKAFNTASNLSTHRKLHLGNRETFSCKQCNLKTVKEDYYLDLMKKKHGGGDGGVGDRSAHTSDDSE